MVRIFGAVQSADAATTPSPILRFLDTCCIWSVTPYALCDFRCIYCNAWAQGRSRPSVPQPEYVERLRSELRAVPATDSFTVGALADAYPPLEAETGLTRQTLIELIAQRRRFHIVTKGDLVLRDLDLLAPYAAHTCVHVSLCSLDDDVLRVLDPGAPSATRRLEVIEAIRRAGVPVQVSGAPWIPGVTDADALLDRTHATVMIQFAPLNVGKLSPALRILGRRYTQDEVNRLYVRERRRLKRRARALWLHPVGETESADTHQVLGYMR